MSPYDIKTSDAVLAFGGKTRFAEAIGYSRQAIYDFGTYLSPKVAKLAELAADRNGITLPRSVKRRRAA